MPGIYEPVESSTVSSVIDKTFLADRSSLIHSAGHRADLANQPLVKLNSSSEIALISQNFPFLGVWGGSAAPEFEQAPPDWIKAHLSALAIREVEIVRWSNTIDDWRAQPCGAGMCLRRVVAEAYAKKAERDRSISSLGRCGTSLMSAEDTDIVYTARDVDLGFGTFPQLSLTHLIPASRMSENYLLRLSEGISASGVLLSHRIGSALWQTSSWKTALRFIGILAWQGTRGARFYLARKRGAARGKRLLESLLR